MNKNFLIAVIALLVLGAGFVLVKNSSTGPDQNGQAREEELDEDVPQEVSGLNEDADQNKANADKEAPLTEKKDEEREDDEDKSNSFELEASNYKYNVKEIRAKQGSQVTVKLTVKEGFHDFVVDEFNARIKQLAVGQSETVEFTADKKGIFEYYCSVGQHRQNGMVGKLIVE